MAVNVYDPRAIAGIRRASRAAAATLASVGARLRPGVTTAMIDAWVREDTARCGGRPSQLGYHGFPASVCTSRNDVICHGIPSPSVVLRSGDILNVDVTTELDGFHGDTSATFLIGDVGPQARRLVACARAARDAGIAAIRPGARLGDIGAAIVATARAAGFSVVADYGGHGIGRAMHEAPHVSHVGRAGTGLRLRPGMCLTVEPMINEGRAEGRVAADGWTVRTADGGWSAQFEHTVCVTPEGVEVLTIAAPPGPENGARPPAGDLVSSAGGGGR
ncbi:MAG: type I methionyl aminopeptidase [Nannocystaceae bacterium]